MDLIDNLINFSKKNVGKKEDKNSIRVGYKFNSIQFNYILQTNITSKLTSRFVETKFINNPKNRICLMLHIDLTQDVPKWIRSSRGAISVNFQKFILSCSYCKHTKSYKDLKGLLH